MKNKNLLAAMAATLGLFGVTAASAAHHENGPPQVRPVEAYACNFKDGQGMDDLNKVIARWNKWMDKTDESGYQALIMTPNFVGEFAFAVYWIGVAKDGPSMGKALDAWRNEDQGLGTAFFDVIDCASHTNFASMPIVPPTDDTPANPTATFADCEIDEDSSMDSALEAIGAWAKYRAENGSKSASWVWFPAYGESQDAAYDFKWVVGTDGYTNLFTDWEQYGNGGGWQKAQELFTGVLNCDSPRVYDVRQIRSAK